MFRTNVFRNAITVASARSQGSGQGFRCSWGYAVAGTAAAATISINAKQRSPPAGCIDWESVGVGVGIAAGAGTIAYILQQGAGKKPKTFEHRLRKAYSKNNVAQAVLRDMPAAHPDFVKAAVVEQDDIKNSSLAVANHIREVWASILAEAFHFPKAFFMSTKDVAGNWAKDGKAVHNRNYSGKIGVGTYKVAIPLLKHNKVAVAYGIDKLAAAFDRNGDGALDFHEFATLMIIHVDFSAEKMGYKKRSKQEIVRMLYTVMDDDGDGKVTRDEFESFVIMASKMGIVKQHDAALHDQLWAKYDKDGNGVMSDTEFLAFARELLDLSLFDGDL